MWFDSKPLAECKLYSTGCRTLRADKNQVQRSDRVRKPRLVSTKSIDLLVLLRVENLSEGSIETFKHDVWILNLAKDG